MKVVRFLQIQSSQIRCNRWQIQRVRILSKEVSDEKQSVMYHFGKGEEKSVAQLFLDPCKKIDRLEIYAKQSTFNNMECI